jgi:hypothetical protein
MPQIFNPAQIKTNGNDRLHMPKDKWLSLDDKTNAIWDSIDDKYKSITVGYTPSSSKSYFPNPCQNVK